MKKATYAMLSLILAGMSSWLGAHCEIPCGIFGDQLRIQLLEEHIQTVEKSIKSIQELSAADPKNYNQLVRWIENKETHAEHIQETVCQYFLFQRIKPVEPADAEKFATYQKQLTLLHHMLVYAMKAKQSTDLANVEKLRELLRQFADSYFGPAEKAHLQSHAATSDPDGTQSRKAHQDHAK